MGSEIIIVSGLPRSGTSLMMQMLDKGGVSVLTDNVRAADTDNPRGYFEFEPVKAIKRDATWLPAARGKAVKMVSQLLYDLPPGETYRIVFMERDLEEVLASQEKMLRRLGRVPAPREDIRRAYAVHLERLHGWLGRQANMTILCVRYNDLLERPREQADRVLEFLGGPADIEGMVKAVDPALYRNREAGAESAAGRPAQPTAPLTRASSPTSGRA
jgi:Sulfotransferase domain